jgi:hypothetical protein
MTNSSATNLPGCFASQTHDTTHRNTTYHADRKIKPIKSISLQHRETVPRAEGVQ